MRKPPSIGTLSKGVCTAVGLMVLMILVAATATVCTKRRRRRKKDKQVRVYSGGAGICVEVSLAGAVV